MPTLKIWVTIFIISGVLAQILPTEKLLEEKIVQDKLLQILKLLKK